MFKTTQKYVDASSSNYTLAFEAGETLCVLEKTNDTWWLASNQHGNVGYVLSSYLTPSKKASCIVGYFNEKY